VLATALNSPWTGSLCVVKLVAWWVSFVDPPYICVRLPNELTMTATVWPFVETADDGVAYIQGTTTKVIEIAIDHAARDLLTAEEIQTVHPSLMLAQIHAALGYYYDHREECDRQIEERRQRTDQLLGRLENPLLQERLRKLKAGL
jgi:uncharacterized protein (DUF433 family)